MSKTYKGRHYTVTRAQALSAIKKAGDMRGASKIIGCSMGTMLRICRVLNIEIAPRGRRQRAFTKSELLPFATKKGYSWEAIAREFGCSVGLIRAEFKRFGLTKRDERSKNADYPCEL